MHEPYHRTLQELSSLMITIARYLNYLPLNARPISQDLTGTILTHDNHSSLSDVTPTECTTISQDLTGTILTHDNHSSLSGVTPTECTTHVTDLTGTTLTMITMHGSLSDLPPIECTRDPYHRTLQELSSLMITIACYLTYLPLNVRPISQDLTGTILTHDNHSSLSDLPSIECTTHITGPYRNYLHSW